MQARPACCASILNIAAQQDQSSVPSGRGGAREPLLVLPDRIELSTSPLPRECSTTELRQRAGWIFRKRRGLATRGRGAQAPAKPRQMLLRAGARVLPVGELEQHLLDPFGREPAAPAPCRGRMT